MTVRTYALCIRIYVFVIERETGSRERDTSKEEVTEFQMRTKAIVLLQHPHFLLTVISALLSHPTLDRAPPVAPGTPAPADKEGKRETGRTPEGNRCLRYPGFTYRERGGGMERRGEERMGSGKGKSIYHWISLF